MQDLPGSSSPVSWAHGKGGAMLAGGARSLQRKYRGGNVSDTVHAGRDLSPAEPESSQQVIVYLGVRGISLGFPMCHNNYLSLGQWTWWPVAGQLGGACGTVWDVWTCSHCSEHTFPCSLRSLSHIFSHSLSSAVWPRVPGSQTLSYMTVRGCSLTPKGAVCSEPALAMAWLTLR